MDSALLLIVLSQSKTDCSRKYKYKALCMRVCVCACVYGQFKLLPHWYINVDVCIRNSATQHCYVFIQTHIHTHMMGRHVRRKRSIKEFVRPIVECSIL